MRIRSVSLDAKETTEGLGPVTMRRLGQIVLLVGPNGGGKSRLLRLVKAQADHPAVSSDRFRLEGDRSKSPDVCVFFGPKGFVLTDPDTLAPQQADSHAEHAAFLTLHENLHVSAPAYARLLLMRHLASKDEPAPEFERLSGLVHDVLGTHLRWDADAHLTLFDRRVGASLSEGQAALFQLAVALHLAGASRLNGCVLLWDEPELHLHPDALLKVFEGLRSRNADGQIWLASHSAALAAAVGRDALWYVDDGTVRWVMDDNYFCRGDDNYFCRLGRRTDGS